MSRPICVQTSTETNRPKSDNAFNNWQQHLNDDREFLRLIDQLKMALTQNRER